MLDDIEQLHTEVERLNAECITIRGQREKLLQEVKSKQTDLQYAEENIARLDKQVRTYLCTYESMLTLTLAS